MLLLLTVSGKPCDVHGGPVGLGGLLMSLPTREGGVLLRHIFLTVLYCSNLLKHQKLTSINYGEKILMTYLKVTFICRY